MNLKEGNWENARTLINQSLCNANVVTDADTRQALTLIGGVVSLLVERLHSAQKANASQPPSAPENTLASVQNDLKMAREDYGTVLRILREYASSKGNIEERRAFLNTLGWGLTHPAWSVVNAITKLHDMLDTFRDTLDAERFDAARAKRDWDARDTSLCTRINELEALSTQESKIVDADRAKCDWDAYTHNIGALIGVLKGAPPTTLHAAPDDAIHELHEKIIQLIERFNARGQWLAGFPIHRTRYVKACRECPWLVTRINTQHEPEHYCYLANAHRALEDGSILANNVSATVGPYCPLKGGDYLVRLHSIAKDRKP